MTEAPASLRPVTGTPRAIHALVHDWLGDSEATALIVRTSGSTGEPTDVSLSRRAVLASAHASLSRLGGAGQWLLALPPSYVAGLQVLVRSSVADLRPVVLSEHADLTAAANQLSADRRYLAAVPTQLHRWLSSEADISVLRQLDAVLLGGAAVSADELSRARELGVRVVTSYGMSETCGGCVYDGVPLDGVAVALGTGGQVRLAGPVLFDGYAGRPQLTAQVLRDGWLHTSDLGSLDSDGRLRVTGRADDVVKSGGIAVSLSAVERRIAAMPDVDDVAVLGVPDDEWGARVVAVVQGAQPPKLAAVRDFVSVVHPREWAPRELHVRRPLPKLVSGKVDRQRLLRELLSSPPASPEASRHRPLGVAAPTDRPVAAFSLPLNVRFRGVDSREGLLLFGAAGVGEFSPFWDYGVEESSWWLAAALEAAEEGFPTALRSRVPVNCTVAAVAPDAAAAIVRASGGCRTAKVKVAERGQPLEYDLARVAAVRAALGPGGRVRVDANGAWSVDEAVEAIGQLAEFDLEYVEQPCATVEELAALRRRVDVPIAADESIRRAHDPLRVAELEAADIAVLKVQPLGGVRRCLQLAEQIGLPVVVSSALESSVGIAAGVALAAALPELPYACGLATTSMLRADVTASPLTPVDGLLAVRAVLPDTNVLQSVAPDDSTTRRWLDRLEECRAVLASRCA